MATKVGSEYANDYLVGTSYSDSLYGLGGNDYLSGGLGADHLNGGSGRDTLMGGIGDDTLYGGNGDDVLRGGIGLDDIFSGTGQDTFVVAAGESALLGEVDRFADYDFRYDYLDGPVPGNPSNYQEMGYTDMWIRVALISQGQDWVAPAGVNYLFSEHQGDGWLASDLDNNGIIDSVVRIGGISDLNQFNWSDIV